MTSLRLPRLEEEAVATFVADAAGAGAAAAAAPVPARRRRAGLEDEDGLRRRAAGEDPVVDVPEHLHRRLVDDHRLVAPELPLQAPDVHQHDAVHRDPHLRLPRPGDGAVHDDLVVLSAGGERRAGGEGAPAGDALAARHEHGVVERRAGPGPLERVLLAVAEEEDDLVAAHQRHVVAGGGLRAARRELGRPEVPDDVEPVAVDVERLGAPLAPERPRLQLHLVAERPVVPGSGAAAAAAVDGDGEGLVDEGPVPHGGHVARGAVDLGAVDGDAGAVRRRRRGRRRRRRRRRPGAARRVVAGRRAITADAAAAAALVHLAGRLAGFGSLVHDLSRKSDRMASPGSLCLVNDFFRMF